MTRKSPVRSCENVDETEHSYADVKAFVTGNPEVKEKMFFDVEVTKLKLLKFNRVSNQYYLEDAIAWNFSQQIVKLKEQISEHRAGYLVVPERLAVTKARLKNVKEEVKRRFPQGQHVLDTCHLL